MASSARGPRLPLPITDKSPILVSHIPLPTLPSIAYAKFVPILQEEQHKAVELARQWIINYVRRGGKSIEKSLLPIVHIGKEDVALWVFSIRSVAKNQKPSGGGKGKDKKIISVSGDLEDLTFDGLQRCDLSQFAPSALYPCSSECAELPDPCSSCTNVLFSSPAARGDRSTVSSATLFPRISLRAVYAHFIDAVRERLIDDICIGPHHPPEENVIETHVGRPCAQAAIRLGHGFLSNGDHIYPTWGCGWEQRSHNRPLVHTSLHVYMSPRALHIRPLPIPTRLLSIPVWCSPSSSSRPVTSNPPSDSTLSTPSLNPGAPLILAPYSTPAFYVSTHAGTSVPNSLRSEFWDVLNGLGILSSPPHSFHHSSTGNSFFSNVKPTSANTCPCILNEPFVLTFIPLLNPQGEPKGVTALWPARLAFVDTSPNRFNLTSLPELPGAEALLTPSRGAGAQPSAQTLSPTAPSPVFRRLSSIPSQFTCLGRAQRALRALELSSHKRAPEALLLGTAKTTAGYVESVAKERERERERAIQERIRREREAKETKSSSSGVVLVSPNATHNVPQISQTVEDAPGADSASPKTTIDTARPGYSWHSVPTNFFAKAAHDSVVHSFYPSPPDWNPVSSTQSSGILESTGNIAPAAVSSSTTSIPHSTLHSQPGSSVNQQAVRESINLSNGIDLGMDIDINDMSMGINLESPMDLLDVNMGVNIDTSSLMDGGFGNFADAFTDDDFNYFDAAPAPTSIPLTADIQRPLHHLNADESAMDGWLTDGLVETDPGANVISSQLQPATPASVDASRDSLAGLHQLLEDDTELFPPAPDLIPSSPSRTPWSPSSPSTPSLELNAPPASPVGKRMFEPIYFGNRHLVADGKYRDIKGKFAFFITLPRFNPPSGSIPGMAHVSTEEDCWKIRYDAITDPRVGVINRLRGIKRKVQDKAHESKTINGRKRDEEWESIYDQRENTELSDDTSSSEEEEEDVEEMELEQDQSDGLSSQSHPSRPNTPPPTGLPLTATPLYFHFHHSHLLALSVPMRPSYGELVSQHNPPPALTSVPTPVSPAAALGNATERNKTFELLAQAIAKEAVENHIWAQAWGSLLDGLFIPHSPRTCYEVSLADLRYIARLMEKIPGLKGPSLFSDLLDYPSPSNTESIQGKRLQMLTLPRISIGRAGLVHHVFPTAIRFWEKEGLGPRGGTKDVVAFALFEEGNDDKIAMVDAWMGRVGRAYSARGFGTHTAGNAGTFERGLVPIQFETVRKILPNLMSVLPREPQHIVLYIMASPVICSSLKSPALRAILMTQKRTSKLGGQHDFDQDRVLIHFVPDHYIMDPFTYPSTRHVGLESLVNSVYDRLLRTTLRQTSRQFWEYNPPFENRFQVPAFTLSRNKIPQTCLEWDERPSLNVLDRHTFLNVGYCLSACRRWLLAACIDERGEAHDVAVWAIPHQNDPLPVVSWMVSNIWSFVKQFAQRADTEWRIIVSKLGVIGESEAEVWMSYLETMVSTHTGPPIHVSLVCAQSDIPFPILFPLESGKEKKPYTTPERGAVFTDVSSVTYSVLFPHRTPIISPGLLFPWDHPSLVKPADSGEEVDEVDRLDHAIGILPLSTTALLRVSNNTNDANVEALHIHLLFAYKSTKSTLKQTTNEVHADITRNWYDLAVLTRERWHFSLQRQLPFHLAALELMSNVLHPNVLTPEAKDVDYIGS